MYKRVMRKSQSTNNKKEKKKKKKAHSSLANQVIEQRQFCAGEAGIFISSFRLTPAQQ